ncbi:MAG TPA: lipocalin-like domain-containing protein [Candidatus Aquilonibacter sp.]|nr:lipocalin-like domain-containing protein [Candidatus Aquilonibacter sp.]
MTETVRKSSVSVEIDDRIIGTWKLVSASSTTASGERDEAPYRPGATGFLTYTAEGRVTALISYGGRKPLGMAAGAEEQAEAFKTFFGYAGTYALKGDTVIHHIEVSSIQNYVSRDLIRTVKIETDRIILTTPPTLVNGKNQTVELIWQRV